MSHDDEGAGASRPVETGEAARDLAGLAIAAGLLLLAALIAWDASSYPERRNYAQFGPEIFPYMVAAGMAALAAVTVVMALRASFPPRDHLEPGPVVWVVLAVVLEIVLLTFGAGFIVASGVLFGFCARGMGRRPVWYTFLVGAVFSALLYVLFRHALGLSLPAGPIERAVDLLLR